MCSCCQVHPIVSSLPSSCQYSASSCMHLGTDIPGCIYSNTARAHSSICLHSEQLPALHPRVSAQRQPVHAASCAAPAACPQARMSQSCRKASSKHSRVLLTACSTASEWPRINVPHTHPHDLPRTKVFRGVQASLACSACWRPSSTCGPDILPRSLLPYHLESFMILNICTRPQPPPARWQQQQRGQQHEQQSAWDAVSALCNGLLQPLSRRSSASARQHLTHA
jgi:hypothetical protein